MVRNIYLKKAEARLADLGDEIESLRRKADAATAEGKELLNRQVASLREKAEVVRVRIRAVRDAEAPRWGKVKQGVEDALDDLRKSVESAVRKLRKTGSGNR